MITPSLTTSLPITHIITGLKPAGAERLLLEMTARLVERGWDCDVVALRHGEMVEEFYKRGVHAISLERSKGDPRVIGDLGRFLSRRKPALVHAHLFEAECAAWLAVRGQHTPVLVSTQHGLDVFRLGPGLSWLNQQIGRRTSCVIAVSKAVRDFCVYKQRIQSCQVQVITNGVDVSLFRPLDDATRHSIRAQFKIIGQPVVGMVGRLVELKGHRYTIDAWPQVVAALPGAHLVLIGDGALRAQLQEQVHRLGIASSVSFLGHQTRISELVAALDLLISSSVTEGLSMAAIEALAAGCPVVATDVGGLSEVVSPDVGYLVPPRDSTAIVRAVLRVFQDSERWLKMKIAARKRAVAHFDIERCVDKIEKLYTLYSGSAHFSLGGGDHSVCCAESPGGQTRNSLFQCKYCI